MRDTAYQDTKWAILKENLTSDNRGQRQAALIEIKDAVIGSNRQKGALISHDLVPNLLNIATLKNGRTDEKIDSLIILGSLAKGTQEQVNVLIQRYYIIPVLIGEVILERNDPKCIEVGLSTLKSLYEFSGTPADAFFMNTESLKYFLELASPQSSLKTQICVTSILVSLCQTYEDQMRFLLAGTINVISRMICSEVEQIQVPALRCLSYMCYSNRSVSDNICVTSYHGKSLPDILNSLMSRLFLPEIQLTAARCLTCIYRSGTLPPTDNRILHKTLPALTRLCTDTFEDKIRSKAAETLSYLIEIDSDLQRTAAISNHLLKSLSQLLHSPQSYVRKSALRCFASLGANDETIRKRIVDTCGFIDAVLKGLNDNDEQVKLAAIRCLHSLSRSVQQLRTTFQDHAIWKPLMKILENQESVEFLVAVSTTLCNLLLEFSPSKEPLIDSGILDKLCTLTQTKELSLRINCVWALMNMSYRADDQLKLSIVNALSVPRILNLMCDTDPMVMTKTLGLVRNLLSQSLVIDHVMSTHAEAFLEVVVTLLNSCNSNENKEQILRILANIAVEARKEDYIIKDAKLLNSLQTFITHSDHKLQAGALYIINNIVQRKDTWCEEEFLTLNELNIIKSVKELLRKTNNNKGYCDDYLNGILKQIIVQCKEFSTDIKEK